MSRRLILVGALLAACGDGDLLADRARADGAVADARVAAADSLPNDAAPRLDAGTRDAAPPRAVDAGPPPAIDATPPDARAPVDAAPPAPDAARPDPNPRAVTAVGPEEAVGDGAARPSIAVDARGQPHVAVNDQALGVVFLHHRLGGVWSGGLLGAATDFSAQGQLMESPRLEIDPRGRAWISGHLFRSDVVEACGHAIFLVDDVAEAPTLRWARRHYRHWGHGALSLDPAHPDRAALMTFNGMWLLVDDQGEAVGQGEMYPGTTGEKVDFRIAPVEGGEGVWHGMHSGYSRSSSSYQSSVRHAAGEPIVVWAEHRCYPEQGLDTRRPAVGIDGAEPRAAYFSVKYDPGVVINIWDGQRMVFDPCDLPVIEGEPRDQGNGTWRFAPQWAPAKGGGAWLCWTHASRTVRLRHVALDGTLGEIVEVGAGEQCAPATDAAGQLHVAYVRDGRTWYRALTVE